MWGVNGAASVFGSALAMIVGITWGFWSALFVGAAIYMAVAVLFVIVASLNQQTVFTPSSAATPTLEAKKPSARRQL